MIRREFLLSYKAKKQSAQLCKNVCRCFRFKLALLYKEDFFDMKFLKLLLYQTIETLIISGTDRCMVRQEKSSHSTFCRGIRIGTAGLLGGHLLGRGGHLRGDPTKLGL